MLCTDNLAGLPLFRYRNGNIVGLWQPEADSGDFPKLPSIIEPQEKEAPEVYKDTFFSDPRHEIPNLASAHEHERQDPDFLLRHIAKLEA
jgi:hypothetical protein